MAVIGKYSAVTLHGTDKTAKDVAAIKADTTKLKTDVAAINTDLNMVKTDVAVIKTNTTPKTQ